MEGFEITKHILVPDHIKLSEDEKLKVLEKLNVKKEQLPKIKLKDPAIQTLEANPGDIIKVKRKSPTNLETEYYRMVVDE